MPSSGVVDSFGKIAGGSLILNFLGVSVQTARSLFEVEFGSVDFLRGFASVEEVLSPVHVGTRGGLIVVENAVGCENVVDHVGAKGKTHHEAKAE